MKIFSIVASIILLLVTGLWMFLHFNKKKEKADHKPEPPVTNPPPRPRVPQDLATVDEFQGYETTRVILDKQAINDELLRQTGDYCRPAEGGDGVWGKDRRGNWVCNSKGAAA